MSQPPSKVGTVTAAGTNTANQVVAYPYPYVKDADLIVMTVNSGGVATLLALGSGYTVADTTSGNIQTSGSVTILAAVPTTSNIVITTSYPNDQEGDIRRRWMDRGCPVDGPYANEKSYPISSLQQSQKESFTLKNPSTAANP